jgi:nicotinamide-nucleotide adenylyltransferase
MTEGKAGEAPGSGAPRPERFGRLGTVARFKPVHLGHAAVLDTIGAVADDLVVGVGSANRYDVRNPFTAEESTEMVRLVLGERPGLRILPVPDLGHGPRWSAMVAEIFGPLDAFVTANPYVRDLLQGRYRVLHPLTLIPRERHVRVDGTLVRRAMAQGEGWRPLVPPAVAAYLDERGLPARFRREFGLETLALDVPRGIE